MKNYTIDTIKFFAAFAVVVIHTQPFRELDGEIYQTFYFTLRTLSSFAVPFFFACMGFLFYKKISILDNKFTYTISYLKKICRYIIIPVIIYTIYHISKLLLSSNPILYIKEFINDITKLETLYYGIDSAGMYHLWFLLIPLYIIPIIYIFKNKIKLLTVIFLLFNIVGIILQIYGIDIRVRDALFYGGFYICLGCCFCIYEDKIKNIICNISWKYLIYAFIIFNILQLYESILAGNRLTYSFSTIFITIVLFIIFIKNDHILKDNIINKIGSESLGIYLIHPIIIDIIYLAIYIMNIGHISNSIIWQLLFTPIVFVTSYIIYLIINNTYHRIVNTIQKK